MARAKEKPLYSNPTDYEDDFYLWLYEQAELLRLGRYDELDRPNLIEEIESVASEMKHRVSENYLDLLIYLLRWDYQPQMRKRKWLVDTARLRHEIEIEIDEEQNPTLKSEADFILGESYDRAITLAAIWLDEKPTFFPRSCPYSLEQLRDQDWLPGVAEPGPHTLPPLRDPDDE